ncbi:hypothetical protein G443_003741 [Actinoalloteichus cyanogriseus DSM 43889]|uniref:Uncharacterized protein n=1 Tax=Actinoalloteichus caeruleus DSM 43889 TaxID=1120930 RepID=A0ABT1JLS8_ACTCY|nr:hypothetical protein [Actinoalloteichus caeruleus DSM 43889]
MAAGYGTDTEAMSRAARGIESAADDAESVLEDTGPAQASGFGVVHVDPPQPYAEGVGVLAESGAAFVGVLRAFAMNISASAEGYAADDAANTSTVTNAGGNL